MQTWVILSPATPVVVGFFIYFSFIMTKAKNTSSAKTNQSFYHLCSIRVYSGEQEYVIYELKDTYTPFTEEDYYREVLEFCGFVGEAIDEKLQAIDEEGRFEAWPYDDRMYVDPWVQDISKAEYDVLQRYLYCR